MPYLTATFQLGTYMEIKYIIGMHIDDQWVSMSVVDLNPWHSNPMCHSFGHRHGPTKQSPWVLLLRTIHELSEQKQQAIRMLESHKVIPDVCSEVLAIFLECFLHKSILRKNELSYDTSTGERNFRLYLSTSLSEGSVQWEEYKVFVKRIVPLDDLIPIAKAYALRYANYNPFPILVADYTYSSLKFFYLDRNKWSYLEGCEWAGANTMIDDIINHYRSQKDFCEMVKEMRQRGDLWKDFVSSHIRSQMERIYEEIGYMGIKECISLDSLPLLFDIKAKGKRFFFDELPIENVRKLVRGYFTSLEKEFARVAHYVPHPASVIITGEAAFYMKFLGHDFLVKYFPLASRILDPIAEHSIPHGVALYGGIREGLDLIDISIKK